VKTREPLSITLPAGFCLTPDPSCRQLDETTLFGGSPARVLRLSRAGAAALAELRSGPVRSRAAATLARKLTDAGLAHPQPPVAPARPDVTVIIPVRDRAAMLDRCLTALGTSYPVLVVDDGSEDPDAVAAVAAAHRATLLRRPANGGPGAARNTGLAQVTSDLIAFLDSDCVPEPGWIERLAAHLADPAVAAAAPRIVPLPAGPGWAGRYTAGCSCLDLGDQAARVAPGSRVGYVPTAALVVRRAALLGVARPAGVFDPELRWGEDVDLIWRLHGAGWRIRYEPTARVGHHEPGSWPGLLARRFRYGTSAGPLGRRHPDAVAPLALHPWPALTVAGLLAGSPAGAGLGFAGSVLAMRATLRRAGLPTRGVLPAMLTATWQTWLGTGRYATQFAGPLIAGAVLARGGDPPEPPARRWLGGTLLRSAPPLHRMLARGGDPPEPPARRWLGGTLLRSAPPLHRMLAPRPGWWWRAAAASLLLGPPLTSWFARRPALDPARFAVAQLADDVAYGAGVWAGALRSRTAVPVKPVIAWRPLRGLTPAGRPATESSTTSLAHSSTTGAED
jgi:mycofactocin glycosyltransferase